jgi:hypothetical protein
MILVGAPRRDLNPCYRRESGMAKNSSNKLQEHGCTGWRSRSSKKHFIVSPMCPRPFRDSGLPCPFLTLETMVERSLFRAAYYQLIPAIFQQLNFAEWPQFCDHSVTSADVRLSVGPNLSRAACRRPVDLRQSQAWTGGPSERKSALTSGLPKITGQTV